VADTKNQVIESRFVIKAHFVADQRKKGARENEVKTRHVYEKLQDNIRAGLNSPLTCDV
jgi:hypothetical protein